MACKPLEREEFIFVQASPSSRKTKSPLSDTPVRKGVPVLKACGWGAEIGVNYSGNTKKTCFKLKLS